LVHASSSPAGSRPIALLCILTPSAASSEGIGSHMTSARVCSRNLVQGAACRVDASRETGLRGCDALRFQADGDAAQGGGPGGGVDGGGSKPVRVHPGVERAGGVPREHHPVLARDARDCRGVGARARRRRDRNLSAAHKGRGRERTKDAASRRAEGRRRAGPPRNRQGAGAERRRAC